MTRMLTSFDVIGENPFQNEKVYSPGPTSRATDDEIDRGHDSLTPGPMSVTSRSPSEPSGAPTDDHDAESEDSSTTVTVQVYAAPGGTTKEASNTVSRHPTSSTAAAASSANPRKRTPLGSHVSLAGET